MKILIQKIEGYELYAELRPIAALGNKEHELVFTTKWADSKNPDEEHIKAQFILGDEAVKKLNTLVSNY